MTEISAVKENVRASANGHFRCAVTSVKGNIGHTLAAAGIAGLIKAVLVLNRRVIPPQAGLQSPRETLALNGSGFYVPAAPQPFEAVDGAPLRVGVNAFGFGGTNVHVVLEEPPKTTARRAIVNVPEVNEAQLFVISASTPANLAEHIEELMKTTMLCGAQPPSAATEDSSQANKI